MQGLLETFKDYTNYCVPHSITEFAMPQFIISQVNNIGKRNERLSVWYFKNKKKITLNDLEHEPEFHLDQNLNVVVYPDIKAELPEVEIASQNQTLIYDHMQPKS